jgi:cytochrome c biogenesis protein
MKQTMLSFLSSLRLTIVILILVALLSILGTVVPQEYAGGEPLSRMNPWLVKAFRSLQLSDLYHSTWFIILMCLLSLNLITCSVRRFPSSWRLFRTTPSLDRSKPFEDIPSDNILTVEGSRHENADRVEGVLRKRYGRFRRKDTEKGATFYAHKGAYAHLGVYVIHASVLTIIGGAIIGSLFGFEAYVNVVEGESTDMVYLARRGGVKKLGFTVRCDTFSIAYYQNGMPKEYRSELSFLEDDTVFFRGPLLVNHPITIKGMKFYQASYGSIPGGVAHLTVAGANGKPTSLTVGLKDSFSLKESGARVKVERIEEDFMSMGPAVLLSIHASEGKVQFWVFQGIERMKRAIPGLLRKVPKFNPGLFEPYYFKLNDISQTYYTGLQVSRDPGVPTVAVGAVFIVIGFLITFFSSHRRVWIRLEECGGKTEILVNATSNRDPVGLDRERGFLLRRLRETTR